MYVLLQLTLNYRQESDTNYYFHNLKQACDLILAKWYECATISREEVYAQKYMYYLVGTIEIQQNGNKTQGSTLRNNLIYSVKCYSTLIVV